MAQVFLVLNVPEINIIRNVNIFSSTKLIPVSYRLVTQHTKKAVEANLPVS